MLLSDEGLTWYPLDDDVDPEGVGSDHDDDPFEVCDADLATGGRLGLDCILNSLSTTLAAQWTVFRFSIRLVALPWADEAGVSNLPPDIVGKAA